LAATDYIESGATTGKAGLLEDEPRFDYSGGATCPSLLLEPSRTQLAKYSEALNIAPNVIDNATYLYNEIASPSGLTDAPKFEETTANDRHGFYQYVIIADGAVTASVFTKQIDRRYIHFQSDATGSGQSSYIDLQDGSVVSEGTGWTLSAEDYGNGWWRISATATAVAGNRYFIWGMSLNGTTSTYVGNGSEFTFWGLQVEQGSYPTSYIPNHSGGSVTRGADDCQVEDLQSNGIVGNTWTYFFEWGDYVAERNFEMKDSTSFNFLFMVSRLIRYIKQDTSADTLFSLPTNGTSLKALISYDGTTLKGYLNGSLINSVNDAQSSSFSDFDFLRLDRSFDDTEELKQLLIFPEALSDAECITLTTL